MTGTQILNELDDLRTYEEKLEDEVEHHEENVEDLARRLREAESDLNTKERELAETKQEIQRLENEAKNYWRKND